MLPQFLPLFLPNPLLELLDKEKVFKASKILKNYFEDGNPEEAKRLLVEQNTKWKEYLDKLQKIRRQQLFNTAGAIPDEEEKIVKMASEGNKLAAELSARATSLSLLSSIFFLAVSMVF